MKTMGMAVVARFAASAAIVVSATMTSGLRGDEFLDQRLEPLAIAACPSRLDQQVLTLDVAELPQGAIKDR